MERVCESKQSGGVRVLILTIFSVELMLVDLLIVAVGNSVVQLGATSYPESYCSSEQQRLFETCFCTVDC